MKVGGGSGRVPFSALRSIQGMDLIILDVIHGRASEEERARLREWRRRSPGNEQYYQDFVMTLDEAWAASWDEVSDSSRPSVEQILARAFGAFDPDGRGGVVAESGDGEARPPGGRSRNGRVVAYGLAIAAGMIGIGLGFGLRSADSVADFHLGTGEIITGPSETTTVKLGDGSTVRLAPGSRLLISENSEAREVWLDGRAYFAVRHLDGVPFRVRSHAGDAVVLGTRFELQASEDRLRALVVEGTVELKDRDMADRGLEVTASQVGQVAPAAPPTREVVDPATLDRELAWLGDFLVFEGTPLGDVAAELSHHFGLPIQVLDTILSTETVHALFFEESLEEVVEVICRALAARCSVQPSGAIIGP